MELYIQTNVKVKREVCFQRGRKINATYPTITRFRYGNSSSSVVEKSGRGIFWMDEILKYECQNNDDSFLEL